MTNNNESATEVSAPDTLVAPLPTPLPTPGRGTGWLLLFALVYLLATVIYFGGLGAYMAISQPGIDPKVVEETINSNMLVYLPGMYLTQFIFLLPLIFLASRFPTQSFRETLALKPVRLRQLVFWLGVYAIYQLLAVAMHALLELPVEDFMQQMADQPHLPTALTIVLLAPVLEELVFRGYLFKAWRHSWLGASGTILLTSVLFVLLHTGQYSWIVMGQLFVFAVILGLAREKTGSVLTSWLLHMLNNLIAVVMVMYLGLL